MAFDYAKMAKNSDRIIEKFGQSATHTKKTTGAYSLTTGVAAETTATQTVRMVLVKTTGSRLKNFGLSEINDSIIGGSMFATISVLNSSGTNILSVSVNDTITDAASNIWNVIAVNDVSPAGASVVYQALVSK